MDLKGLSCFCCSVTTLALPCAYYFFFWTNPLIYSLTADWRTWITPKSFPAVINFIFYLHKLYYCRKMGKIVKTCISSTYFSREMDLVNINQGTTYIWTRWKKLVMLLYFKSFYFPCHECKLSLSYFPVWVVHNKIGMFIICK